jgi:hypothetical protein
MSNLTHSQKATLNIVFDTFPNDLTFDEVLDLIPAYVDDKTREIIFNEPFEGFFRGTDLKIEILRIHSLIIDTLIKFNDERYKRVMAALTA